MPAKQDTTTDVVVRKSTDIVAIDELELALRTGELPEGQVVEVDPEEISRQMIAQLLDATTDEELERQEAESWKDFEDVPFEIHSFAWLPSTFDEGQAVFLVVRAIDLRDGEPRVLTTGSGQVMAVLVNLAKRDRLPAIRELRSGKTKVRVGDDGKAIGGFDVYWLETPEHLLRQQRDERAAARAAAESDAA